MRDVVVVEFVTVEGVEGLVEGYVVVSFWQSVSIIVEGG